MVLFFFGAVALLVLAIALGLQAGKLRNRRIRLYFWCCLVSGLLLSALFLGWAGKWWLAAGPLIPLFLILLLRIRFPAFFDQEAFAGREPGTEKEEDRKPQEI